MSVSDEYGHLHLSVLYRPAIGLDRKGLVVAGRHYPWDALRGIDVWEERWPPWAVAGSIRLLPRARVHLAGGPPLLLRGDALVKRGRPLAAGYATAFDELVARLQALRQGQLRGTAGGCR
ncbi:MAG: hypothetical protein KDH20_18675 [Rhodocyclaceae bacterium]|nr:hypothetical protein [Rhodocyclaceae bacterium]